MRFIAGRWMDDSDFTPMGEPETRCELPGDLTLGLYIPAPFGPHTDATLTVRAQENGKPGGEITMAIGTLIDRATVRRFDVNVQSGPQRFASDKE